MRQRLLSHLTYANVMVTILAFIVLGGGSALAAYIVDSNSQIGPGVVSGHKPPSGDHANIIGGSVNGQDLAAGAVTNGKIAANAVDSSKVANNSLTGADIQAGTLGTVPRATNADQLGGVGASLYPNSVQFAFNIPVGTSQEPLRSLAGTTVLGACEPIAPTDPQDELKIWVELDNSGQVNAFTVESSTGSAAQAFAYGDAVGSSTPDLVVDVFDLAGQIGGPGRWEGQIIAHDDRDNGVTIIPLHAFVSNGTCEIQGAILAPNT